MRLTRTETVDGLLAEYEAFSGMLRDLTPEDWMAPTRCTGWEVRDVAGHVIGGAEDVAGGKVGRRSGDEQARALRGFAAVELADRLAGANGTLTGVASSIDENLWEQPSGVHDGTIGEGVLLLWFDAFIHADDIRAAIGLAPVRGRGLHAALCHLEIVLNALDWGPASVELEGFGTMSSGDDGSKLGLDPYVFVLAATGRTDPAPLGLDDRVNVYRT